LTHDNSFVIQAQLQIAATKDLVSSKRKSSMARITPVFRGYPAAGKFLLHCSN
jgi:hypothetical protein